MPALARQARAYPKAIRHTGPVSSDATANDPTIDWERLAREFDAVTVVSTRDAQLALAEIVGADRLRAAVDWYIAGRPGSELARFVLWQLRPLAARDRCLEVWRSSFVAADRQMAVELLRVVATGDDLWLVAEFLADADAGVQLWGIGVLDQLAWSNLVEREDVMPILALADGHLNPEVREKAEFIRDFLRDREEADG
jgi:hypothetical protein